MFPIATIVTDWIQAVASLAAAVLAGIAVVLARTSLKHSHEATRIAGEAAGLERQKVLGSAVGLADLSGFSSGRGEDGLLIAVADYMRPSREPELLGAHLETPSGEEFGAPTMPFAFMEKGAEELKPAKGLVIPSVNDGAAAVFFVLSPTEQRLLRPAGNEQGLGENAVTLPRGTVLRLAVRDPLGQEQYTFDIDRRAFVFMRG